MKKHKHYSRLVMRIFILLIMLLSALLQTLPKPIEAGYDPTYGWEFYEPLDDNNYSPHYFDLELDENGNPHVLYYNDELGVLYYKYYDGTEWIAAYTNTNFQNAPLAFIGLELDELLNPHIFWYYTPGITLSAIYTYLDGTEWKSTPLDFSFTNNQIGYSADFELTSSGLAKFGYFDETESALKVTTWQGTTHIGTETVDSGNAYTFISMDLDDSNQPHFAYCQRTLNTCNRLKYAGYNGSGWTVETVDEAPFDSVGVSASLALDSQDRPHIAYGVSTSTPRVGLDLKYAVKDNTWYLESIEHWGSFGSGFSAAIAIDDLDYPHVAYHDPVNDALDYKWHDRSSWKENMDPTETDMGTFINLELDANGNPTLAFYDTSSSQISVYEYLPQPDLAVTNFWVEESGETYLVGTIRNVGEGVYHNEFGLQLFIDNVPYGNPSWFFNEFNPGDTYYFDLIEPVCPGSSPTMEVKVCLINNFDFNPTNDCLAKNWACDSSPLEISDFVISAITQTGFIATWTTNRSANTELKYTLSDGRSELVYQDNQLVTNHSAVITGLEPHQVYYARAYATDAAGVIAKSARKTIRTLAGSPGNIPDPTLYFERTENRSEIYNLNAYYPDTSNIERVEFRLDGVLVGTDFTPEDGKYTLQFPPGRNGYSRDEFYNIGHSLTTNAFSYGAISPDMYENVLEFQRENYPVESQLLAPDSDSTIAILEDTVPPGTTVDIEVFAQQYEWECTYGGAEGLPACEDVANPVKKVEFYIDGVFKASDLIPENGVYKYLWNLSGLTPGDHLIKARVIATDDGVKEHNATLHIVKRQTVLRTDRTIFRVNNTFRVRLRIFNDSSSLDPVLITSVKEFIKGFQPINQRNNVYTVHSSTSQNGKTADVNIYLNQPLTLQPGENLEFTYYVVPVLYPDMETAEYFIGKTSINYELLGLQRVKIIEKLSQVWDSGSIPIAASAANAFATSDYLLITAPSALKSHYVADDADKLMADMAWLAQLKQGVLAYWDPNLSKENLKALLQDQSQWTSRLHPKFSQQYGGYVLLVGETEVIPSATTGPFDNNVNVNFSDHFYAATDSGAVLAPPDLLVGRIIGDTAADLDRVILNSIDTHVNNQYARSQAHIGSGSEFRGTGISAQDDLSALGYNVSMHHYEEEIYFNRYENINFKAHDGLTHGDVNGDGSEELIWAQDSTNKVYFISPLDGTKTFAFNLDFADGDSLAAGDVNADPQLEIVIADCDDTIRTYDVNGTQVASFSTGVQTWDKVAVGDVLYSNSGQEIVLAKGTDYIRIFSYAGTELADFDLLSMGYHFSAHDDLKIGNILEQNDVGPEEIVFTDLQNGEVVVMAANGNVLQTYQRTLQAGDALELADVKGLDYQSIILMNSDSGDLTTIEHGYAIPLHAKAYDGIVSCDVQGQAKDFVFYLNQKSQIFHIDMDYPEYSRQLFHESIDNTDLVWFFAHGAPNGIWPIVTSTIPETINGSHPIVNAWSCSAGAYEAKSGYSDNAFAENFLQAGAGVYLGSTETALSAEIRAVNNDFYTDYWGLNGWRIAEAFARRESDLLLSSEKYALFMGWFVNEFNYYGDPKFDVFESSLMNSPQTLQEVNSELVIDLPAYTISDADGKDFVEIPADSVLGTHSGTHYTVYDEYQVPIYIHTIEIPAGQQVQNVSLIARDNKTSEYGLDLPVSEYVIVAESENTPGKPEKTNNGTTTLPGHDWSPNFEQPYRWSVTNHQEGGATLKLILYPFYYDPAALYSEYHQHFVFNIEMIPSSVTISGAQTNKSAYAFGEDIILNLAIENSEPTPIDAIVRAVILKGSTGEPVDGFVLTALPALTGTAKVDLAWNWSDDINVPAGDYSIEISVEDMDGQRLASRNIGITLGSTQGQVSHFTVSSERFTVGDIIDIEMHFANVGVLPIDGEAVIQVQTLRGEIISDYREPFTGLPSSSVIPVTYAWDSAGALDTDYKVVGYVQYNSQTTPPKVLNITTLIRNYLPTIVK